MHTVRSGSGRPLVMVPGVGASSETWEPVLPALTAEREVVSVDLPGFGRSAPLPGQVTVAGYADALEAHLRDLDLLDADLVGSSLGARLVLELVRRGHGRSAVALDPGGFWEPWQKKVFGATLRASVALVRLLRPALPTLLATPVGRTALLAQLSARPWALDPDFAVREVRTLADSPSADDAVRALAQGPDQQGAPAGTLPGRLLLVWGAHDRVTLTSQSTKALRLFPDARHEVFERSGHFPHWDEPERTARTILDATA